ncbi:MAG: GumC family protein [Gallionellaceae bacterium]
MTHIDTGVRQGSWRSKNLSALPSSAARVNRRRLLVFLGVFILACAVSLSYTFLRPAEYRAAALIQITPAAAAPTMILTAPGQPSVATEGSPSAEASQPFLAELQVLTSRPILEQAIERLRAIYDLSSLGPDPVMGFQSMLHISPANGTNVVELAGTGRHAHLLAPLLNTVIAVFQEHVAAAYRDTTAKSLAAASDETAKLEASLAAKQKEAELFRIRNNIISPEREENEVLARVTGLSTSLNKANETADIAEGKLRSLRDAVAAGDTVVRAKDDPTLADLEKRASQLREDLSDQERSFTPAYMAMDPAIRAKRTQLENLEQQVKSQRVVGQQQALAEAEAEAASARETVNRIRQQGAQDRNMVQKFTARFSEYKALQDDLTSLQGLYRAAVQRKLRLEASELDRTPAIQIIEPASTPLQAWRPLYARDAAISIGGAFLLGLLAVWFVELFNRSEPQPAFILAQPISAAPSLDYVPESMQLPAATRALGSAGQALLIAQPALPREFGQDELRAMLVAGGETARLAMLLLLSGIRPEEALAARCEDVDLNQGVIRIAGEPMHEMPLCKTLADALATRLKQPGDLLLADAQGRPIDAEQLSWELLCAAHDAGIDGPEDVSPAALWHTYAASLVRQGIRFADLMQIVGRLSTETMAAYSALAPAGIRVRLDAIERVMPALREPLSDSMS